MGRDSNFHMRFVPIIFSVTKSVEPQKAHVILVNVRFNGSNCYLFLEYLAKTFIQMAKPYKIR